MGTKIQTYRDLDIWNLGIDLVKDIYTSTEKFPKHEILHTKYEHEIEHSLHR